MYFFGSLFIITAILIFFFKPEQTQAALAENEGYVETEKEASLYESYKVVWRLLNLKSLQEVALF
jgi:hypothetical protein